MTPKYKTPRFWLLLLGTLAALAGLVWLLTNLLTPKGDDLLWQVLDSRAAFVDETGQAVRLKDYTPTGNGEAAAPLRHTMLDLDGDGQRELVLYYPQGRGTYLVCHVAGSRVYGYAFPETDFQNLKTDGTFLQMRNTFDAYFYTLTFREETCERKELAYMNWSTDVARLDGQDAKAEDVTSLAVEFWKKSPVQWTFSPDAPDPMQVYQAFLAGEATALEDWQSRRLADYLATDKAHKYAFFDMTGDGQKELCLQTGKGLYIFTLREDDLHLWYGETISGARLLENGMLTFVHIFYANPLTQWNFWAMSEQGRAVFKFHFSQSGSLYIWGDEQIPKEEFDQKTKFYLDLQEMPWQIAVESPPPPNQETSLKEAYEAFLAGEIKAVHSDGKELPLSTYLTADAGTYTYALKDMNGDGGWELLIKMTYKLLIFTVKDQKVCLWHTADAQRYTLLNNGAFLYEHQDIIPTRIEYEYLEIDENGQLKFKITFSHYKIYEEAGPIRDIYHINGNEVTQLEYEETTAPYLQIGSDQIRWQPAPEGT